MEHWFDKLTFNAPKKFEPCKQNSIGRKMKKYQHTLPETSIDRKSSTHFNPTRKMSLVMLDNRHYKADYC